MKTIYRSRKRVTREMTGSTHTLPILIEYAWSMARVCLEYGLSMARVWLEHAYTRHTEGLSPRANEITARRNPAHTPHIRKWKCVGTKPC